ncbi:MAG: FtsX-like permease family protein, partial [Candidatus Thorarchaeota archaeon]
MSAIPVEYEALQGLRRKAVSLLCILLASSMAMGILVYVDSYSIHEWNDQMGQVGSIDMTVEGDNILNYASVIREFPDVIQAEALEYIYGDFRKPNATDYDYWFGGKMIHLTDEYQEAFPDRYTLLEGAYPVDDTEITLSDSIMETGQFSIGDQVNYTFYWEYPETWTLLDIVGIFRVEGDRDNDYWWRPSAVAVIDPDLFPPNNNVEISVNVDRSPLTPFNAAGSLSYLLGIEESIRELDPLYGPPSYRSRLYIDDSLASAISQYIAWQMGMRMSQISRSAGAMLLVTLVIFLAIRHNMNERRYENNMLMSRGASRGDIEKRVLKEVVALSVLGTFIGLGVGVVFSRIGLSATGFFEFIFIQFFTEPFLISLESIIISVLIGLLLPIGTWFGYNFFYSTKKKVEVSTGKIEKATRILSFIRWDVIVFVLSTFFLVGLLSTGDFLLYNPLLSFIASLIPLAMFVSLGSLTIKGLRSGANLMSRGMNHVVGILPSSVGVRRLGKSASSAGPAVLVLVLAISISWTFAVVGASMPLTKQNQGRFAFGGDVAFHLGSYPTPEWSNFTTNVTIHESCETASMIHLTEVLLSSEYWDFSHIVAMDPAEYKYVGYDQWGNQLNDSELTPLMDTLSSSPSGAIITEDIASIYDVSVGDTIRTFSTNYYENEEVFVFTVVGIANALSNSMVTDTGSSSSPYGYYYSYDIGKQTMWVNEDYLGSLISLSNETENILCVRTQLGANGTRFVEEILENGGDMLISRYNWAAATYEMESYTNDVSYQIDRAVDTMLSIATSSIIFAAFVIYSFEGITSRKREIALIRSMGGKRSMVIKAQVAEMTVLILTSFILLALYGPLHIINALIGYRTSIYT